MNCQTRLHSIFIIVAIKVVLVLAKNEFDNFSALSCIFGRNSKIPGYQQNSTNDDKWLRGKTAKFFLYTLEDPEGSALVLGRKDEVSLRIDLLKNKNLAILTHGYMSSKDSPSCRTVKNEFLRSGNFNVIVVDWWELQSVAAIIPVPYDVAVKSVQKVGYQVAELIDDLQEIGVDLDRMILVGHSLGAHVMGIAGYRAKGQVQQIIGLDPAEPFFEESDHERRLSREDAKIVEVIHTNAGYCGIARVIGHLDFYPNGGAKQPGCIFNMCNHRRSYELYAESITSDVGFFGSECLTLSITDKDCRGRRMEMGGSKIKSTARVGMYYLRTYENPPFALQEWKNTKFML